MQTLKFVAIFIMAGLCACQPEKKSESPALSFGIYEMLRPDEIPASLLDTLKTKNIKLEENPEYSILGYFTQSDSAMLQSIETETEIRLLPSLYPVDPEGIYYALIAVKGNPFIVNADIQKAKGKENDVELYFNLKGTQKWAEMTRNNIGKMVVFVIDNKIYTMPFIHQEIKNGTAVINGLEDEAFAKKIAESL